MSDTTNSDPSMDDTVNNVMQSLEDDGLLAEGQEGAAPQPIPSEGEDGAETQTDEEGKPIVAAKVEAGDQPIEPPASWRSDEKAIFASLDRNAQEAILRIDQAQNAHFTQRSTDLAQKTRATDDERQQYQTQRAQYAQELGRLSEMAAQLLPAKFQDIKTEADYLRIKATDPARASEFEAFQMTLKMANDQKAQLQNAQMNDHLNRELESLLNKHPDFRADEAKLKTAIDNTRKTAVEYYGFTPDEVKVIQDHRYVDVLNDARQWREYQANLKAAQTKKAVATPTKVLRQAATTGSTNLATDQNKALLNRAKKATNDREKADLIARAIGG